MAPRASVSALGKQGISHPSCERRTRRSEPKHAVHTQDQLLPLAAAWGQSSCWDGAGRKASRLREPTFFFLKPGNAGKKKHPSPSDSAICKVRAVTNLSITGFRLVRCPRLQAGTGLSWSHRNQPHRESRVLFAGWAWVPLCLSRDSSEATQHPGTLPADHTAIAKPCHGQGTRPSAGSFPPHKPLRKQGENLLLTALQHLNGLKLFIRATTRPSPLL